MNVLAGLDITMIVAAAGGLVAVIAIGFGARALFGGRKDEVIERLERSTNAGMDFGGGVAPEHHVTPERSFARLASFLRPFARLLKPSAGEELSRINQSLVHAG